MLGDIFDALFGCWHAHYSFPITARKSSIHSEAASVTGTYVVCLDCGKEFPYDWNRMKVLHGTPRPAASRRPLPAEAPGFSKAA